MVQFVTGRGTDSDRLPEMAINDAEITGARNPIKKGFWSENGIDSIDRKISVAPMMDGSY